MNISRQISCFVLAAIIGLCGCDGKPSATVDAHAGQGEAVAADPSFEVELTFEGGKAVKVTGDRFAVYEAKPPKDPQKVSPQTFELVGKQFALGGALPADLKLAPRRAFDELVGKSLTIRAYGGDPTAPIMSKITLGDDQVYVAKSGSLVIEKVFHKPGQYAGVTGKFEVVLQQIKLGNPDDPDNKGDQPVGDPVNATGSFTAKATTVKYESM